MPTADGARQAVSIAEVAAAAGVSMQTVSRVSNGSPKVHAATRLRVEAVMLDLGYRPNRAARALRSGRSKSIGVLVFTMESFGNMRTIEAIALAAADAGYSINLISAATRSRGGMLQALQRLEGRAVDGVVLLIETHILEESAIELPADLPLVIVDSAARPDHPLVDTDQAQGARLATGHLLDLGHRTVHHIRGPVGSYAADRRQASWRSTLLARGRDVPDALRGDWSPTSGYEVGRRLAADSSVTAVFASNDQMALGLLRACHELHRSVPGTMSVVGFDDTPESGSFWPPLTTVHQHFDDVGRTSVASLLALLQGEGRQPSMVIPTRLVIRQSSAPPP